MGWSKIERGRRVCRFMCVGGGPGRSDEEVVVGGPDVRLERIPVLLLLVAAHSQHQGHGKVDTLYATVN